MNNYEILRQTIENYIDSPLQKRALLINGEWGSGKTFSVNKILDPSNNNKIIMLSLNGIKDILTEFKKSIIGNHYELKKGVFSFTKKITNKFVSINIEDIIDLFSNQFLKMKEYNCIIIDDVERFNGDFLEFIGFVDKLLINNKKVIIIMNQNELKNNTQILNKQEEKIIEKTINWIPDNEYIFNVIDTISYNNLSSTNLNVYKNILKNLCSTIFFNIYDEESKSTKKINLRLLENVNINSLELINLLNLNNIENSETIYTEIIKNVYIHFYKRTYNLKKIYINYVSLPFVQKYINNGTLNIEKYKKIVDELINTPKDYNNNYNNLYTDSELKIIYENIRTNISNYKLYNYAQIVNQLLFIDHILESNYLTELTPLLINQISNKEIIYCLNNQNCMYLNNTLTNSEKSNIEKINKKLHKNNINVIKNTFLKYLSSNESIKFHSIEDIFTDFLYIDITDDFVWDYKEYIYDERYFFNMIMNEIDVKEILNNVIESDDLEKIQLKFDMFFQLIIATIKETIIDNQFDNDFKKLLNILNSFLNKRDKSFNFYLKRHIDNLIEIKKKLTI